MGILEMFYHWIYHINHIQIIPVNQPIYKDDTGFWTLLVWCPLKMATWKWCPKHHRTTILERLGGIFWGIYTFHMAIWTGIMMITTIHWNWIVTGCPISRQNHVGSYGFVSIPSSWLWSVITYPAYNKVMCSQFDNLQNYKKEPKF